MRSKTESRINAVNTIAEAAGEANIIVIRKHKNDKYTIAVYLVDFLCCGVKNSFYNLRLDESEFEEFNQKYVYSQRMQEIEYVEAHNRIYGAPASERIFKMTTIGQCNRVIHQWCETAGIEKNVTFHSSRHTFAVLSLTAGGDLFAVGKLMGHTDIKSTQVYADVVMDTKVDAVNRVSSFFSQR